jgi:Zn-finger nucleic acid-binding protein
MDSSSLAKRPCPDCGRVNIGPQETCLYCGAAMPAAADEGSLEMRPDSEHAGLELRCPRCAEAWMEEGDVVGITVHRCPACMGIFVDGNTFHWLVRRQVAVAPQIDGDVRTRVQRGVADVSIQYARCPVCDGAMARRNYLNCSGVILDMCAEHGVWLDDAELHQLLIFLQTGGEALARALEEEDRQREALREYQRQLDHFGPIREGAPPDVTGMM